MYSNRELLKKQAFNLFSEGLAEAISEKIDQDAQIQAKELPSSKNLGSVLPYSLATIFLADKFYAKLSVGKFSGQINIKWNGMDDFIFTPDESNPFLYTTSEGRIIQPPFNANRRWIYTRILRGFKKFSSWGGMHRHLLYMIGFLLPKNAIFNPIQTGNSQKLHLLWQKQ